MQTLFIVIHFLITALLIAGSLVHASGSEGLGALGGSSEVYRGSTPRGFEGVISKWMEYIAWAFLVSSFLSAVLVPNFL